MTNINISLNSQNPNLFKPKIVVFGVGGAGGNAINKAENKLQLGEDITMGLGAGTVPEVGMAAAEESVEEIRRYLEGANMVFITSGMGGGTGTGASPAIAKIAKEKGILTIAIITKPFDFEGISRVEVAQYGIRELKKHVDTLMIVSNQNLFKISNVNTGFKDAFKEADDVLHNSVRSITDLITAPGLINLDFADVKTIIKKMGESVMGMGEAEGENRVVKALENAISNPLLNNSSIQGAKGVIVNISGGSDMTMFEVEEAMAKIQSEVDPNANIILGTALNENLEGRLRISIVATGINTGIEEDEENPYSEEDATQNDKASTNISNKSIARNASINFQNLTKNMGNEETEEKIERKINISSESNINTFGNNSGQSSLGSFEDNFFNPSAPAIPKEQDKLSDKTDGMQSLIDDEESEINPSEYSPIKISSIKIDEKNNTDEPETIKKESKGLFGGFFKSKKTNSEDFSDTQSPSFKIHNEDGNLKLNSMESYNSDLELEENITEIPTYLRNKK
jgi:cell division protein FtsZ